MSTSWPNLSDFRASLSASLFVAILLIQTASQAQVSPASSTETLTPPSLKGHPDAPYPAEALRERVEGNVGLELDVDAGGNVVGVRVTTPAGHGFDEAAAEAARQLHVRAGDAPRASPIRSTVQFTYEFHLPPEPPPPPSPAAAAAAAPPRRRERGPERPRSVDAGARHRSRSARRRRSRCATATSSCGPIGSVQDILRVTPGLVMVQHSGGGKANQYFLRGFDADHGTDLALSIDGVPINMVVARARPGLRRHQLHHPRGGRARGDHQGPVLREPGRLRDRGRGEHGLARRVRAQLGRLRPGRLARPRRRRATAACSSRARSSRRAVKATFAAEIGRTNGPFDNPEDWDKYKLFNKLTFAPDADLAAQRSTR